MSMTRMMVERHFHGQRYARMFGIRNMREQAFLTAAVQNIKRIILFCFFHILKPTID